MNYLAHLFLAENSPESRLGNLLGDFVKGSLDNCQNKYSSEIIKGIQNHRQVDVFTDTNNIYKISKKRIIESQGKFSGIAMDIFYDHFLACNWQKFSQKKLDYFSQEIYNILNKYYSILPQRLQQMLPIMVRENWLLSYENVEGIDQACTRLSRRFKIKNNLMNATQELSKCYSELEADFLSFFPEVIKFVQKK